jgi:hypothetical protein
MSDISKVLGNFKEEYSKLDHETQIKLDHFIAGIEEVGQDMVGGTIFEGSVELLNSIMPCLQSISSTITSVKIELENGTYRHDLKWEPNDFIIPSDVLVRAYDRYAKIQAENSLDEDFDSDQPNLLVRQNSGPNYAYDDSTPSV